MNTRLIPYGYKMENGVLLVNEEEAEQVKRIFEMRVNGAGIYAIGKMLYEEQIEPSLESVCRKSSSGQ